MIEADGGQDLLGFGTVADGVWQTARLRSSDMMAQLAALVPPATMGHVEKIAGNLEKMPPKSTYFYPKLLTGLVYNSLKKD